MERHPKVSVLLPTYNYAHYIEEAIESALAQTFTDFELLIVDDQSTDDTAAVVQKYLKDSRVSFIINPENLGLTGNFNRCLELAHGEYIKFLLADDKFHPRLLEQFVGVIEQYPTLSLVATNTLQFGEKNRQRTLPLQGFHTGTEVVRRYFEKGFRNWIGVPTSVMFKKAAIEKVGMFDNRFHLLVDVEMWIRLLHIGDCYIFSEPLVYLRVHNMQASQVIQRSYKHYFESYELIKTIKTHTKYGAHEWNENFQVNLKRRASKCVQQSYRLLPQFYNKKNWRVIKEGLKIGIEEGVLLLALFNSVRKKMTGTDKRNSVLQ